MTPHDTIWPPHLWARTEPDFLLHFCATTGPGEPICGARALPLIRDGWAFG